LGWRLPGFLENRESPGVSAIDEPELNRRDERGRLMRFTLDRKGKFSIASVTLLVLLAAAPIVAAEEVISGRDAMLDVADEYREVLEVYQPGSVYIGAFEHMSRQLEALTPAEVEAYEQVFGPIAARARVNLSILKIVLRHRDIAIHKNRLASVGFPDADLSTLNLEGLWEEILEEFEAPTLPSLADLWDWVTGGLLTGIPDIPLLPESAVPLYCPGDLDGDGLPEREPPEALLVLQLGIQVLELRWQIAGRICDQDLGFVAVFIGGGGVTGNLSFACIFEDLFFFPLKNLFENILACEAYYDGQELEASYLRLGHIHEDIENHESNLGDHDFDVKGLIAELQAIQGEQGDMLETILENQEEIIELLTTPQGQREGWNKKP
jgi:hypothetical protein